MLIIVHGTLRPLLIHLVLALLRILQGDGRSWRLFFSSLAIRSRAISRPYEFTSLNLDVHGAPGVESLGRPRGRDKLDDAGRIGNKLQRRMLTRRKRTKQQRRSIRNSSCAYRHVSRHAGMHSEHEERLMQESLTYSFTGEHVRLCACACAQQAYESHLGD